MRARLYNSISRAALAVFLCAATARPCWSAAIEHKRTTVAGKQADVISVPIRDPAVKVGVQLAYGFPGAAESFDAMLSRSKPAAAVNGTYFRRMTLEPVGDIVVGGEHRHVGGMGTAMTVTADNRVAFRRMEWGSRLDWSEYETVLAAGPTLVRGGEADVNLAAEGFTDPYVVGQSARTATGLTSGGRLILACVREPVSLSELADIMKSLGCAEAMALDGGDSVAMYHGGRTVHAPGGKLTNILLIYQSPKGDQIAYLSPQEGRPSRLGESAWAHFQRGRTELNLGNAVGAVEPLKMAAELDPLNASYHRVLADVYWKLGTREDEASAQRATGRCYNSKGLYHEAISHYEAALKANRRDVEALRGMSRAYGGLGMAGRASDYADFAEGAAYELASTPPRVGTAPVTRLSGELVHDKYVEEQVGFELPLPADWKLMPSEDPAAVSMRGISRPYVAVLHVLALTAPVNLRDYEQAFATGSFKRRLSARDLTVSGRTAYEVLYDEIAMGRPARSRYVFAATDRWLFLLACSTHAEHYGEASRDFDQIVNGLRLPD
jgi:tetratricopeptide (TPR) repeat protein